MEPAAALAATSTLMVYKSAAHVTLLAIPAPEQLLMLAPAAILLK